MVKDILIIGDLGAGSNLIKNMLLLGDFYWPYSSDKFQRLKKQYSAELDFASWITQECTLRFWRDKLGIDLSDDLDIKTYCNLGVRASLPNVFINHSAFWQQEEFQQARDLFDVLYVAPISDWALEWQIRAYCEKKTVPMLHDFCFENDRQRQIEEFKAANGAEKYYELNITNMKSIVGTRQKQFLDLIRPDDFLSLDRLLTDDVDSVVSWLNHRFNQSISIDQGSELLTLWRNKHWPVHLTSDWPYHYLFS